MKSQTELKIGNVGSKTRSPGQILKKHYVRFRGHIFLCIFLKCGQNVCYDGILDKFENGTYQIKKKTN